METEPLALVVEDDTDISIIFAKALRSAGYRVEITAYGQAAVAWLSTTTPDLVVLDLQLPVISGDQVLGYIRATPRLAGVPVVIATAYPKVAEGLRDQADWVLLKPVAYTHLRDLAARLRVGRVASYEPPAPMKGYRGTHDADGDRPLALIVDDDLDLGPIFAGALRAAGFRTEVLSTGDEVRGRLEAAPPAVVVLDLDFSQEAGMALVRWMRGQESLASTRVVVATSLSRVAESLQGEAYLVLVKPLTPGRLRAISAQLQAQSADSPG